MDYGEILFSRFVYSAWEGYKCSVPISREEKIKILDKLYLCGLGKGEFPDEIMNYPTKFSKFIEDLTEKSVREYIYSKHSSIVLNFIEDAPERFSEEIKKNCIVWVCKAINSEEVKHPLGYKLTPKKDFCTFGKGDYVSVHWNYSLEKVDEEFAKKVNESIVKLL